MVYLYRMLNKVVIIFLLCVGGLTSEGCINRSYGEDKIVCVCNGTYCDTIPKPEKMEAPKFLKYTSNRGGLRFLKEEGVFTKTEGPPKNNNAVFISDIVDYQEILGWGGAFTDSAGINIKSLDKDAQENFLRSYFSDEGIEYSLCRVPIGGTDFSTHSYSYDDGEADENLTNFKLAQEDFEYKIPFIRRAHELSNEKLKLFASAWTAPKWMKTNGQYSGFGFLKKEYYQTWADYFIKFLDGYKKEGIEFWGITTGNEPSIALGVVVPINTVGWLPNQMSKWISENLGPTIRNSSYSDIKIMALDDQRLFLPWFLDLVFRNEDARKYVDGIAVHWYLDTILPVGLLSLTHNHFPEKFILGTEASSGTLPFIKHVNLGLWERGESYAKDIIKDLQNWVTGWVDWNMALDLEGGPTYVSSVDSPIIVNATSGEFYKQPMFYALGHFSKFIPRGSVRIVSSQADNDGGILIVAFRRPDQGRAIVILNTKDEPATITIKDNLRGGTELELTEKSITTLLYW